MAVFLPPPPAAVVVAVELPFADPEPPAAVSVPLFAAAVVVPLVFLPVFVDASLVFVLVAVELDS